MKGTRSGREGTWGGRLEIGVKGMDAHSSPDRFHGQRFLLRCPANVLGKIAFVPRRPLPLAQLAFSATGGARIAPPKSVLWFLSCRNKKGTYTPGNVFALHPGRERALSERPYEFSVHKS